MREYDLLIDGKLVGAHGGATLATQNVAGSESVSLVPRTAVRDARRAIDVARRAADSAAWNELRDADRRTALRGVATLLWERQAEIADLDTAEAGIPIRTSSALVAGAIESFESAIEAAGVREQSVPRPAESARETLLAEPYGTVAILASHDAPFVRAISR